MQLPPFSRVSLFFTNLPIILFRNGEAQEGKRLHEINWLTLCDDDLKQDITSIWFFNVGAVYINCDPTAAKFTGYDPLTFDPSNTGKPDRPLSIFSPAIDQRCSEVEVSNLHVTDIDLYWKGRTVFRARAHLYHTAFDAALVPTTSRRCVTAGYYGGAESQ